MGSISELQDRAIKLPNLNTKEKVDQKKERENKREKKIERRLEVVIASRENVPRNHRQLHQFRLPMEIHGRNPSFSGAEREKCCPFLLPRGLKVMAEKGLSPVNAWR